MSDRLEQFKKEIQDSCLWQVPSPCSSACPFSLEVGALCGRLKHGRTLQAYRMYRDAVVFPGIVSALCPAPCREQCEFAAQGAGLELPALERSMVAHVRNRTPNRYNLPGKEKSVAVIGAGGAGMACALYLASRRYRVTVYERGEEPGGAFLTLASPDLCREEFGREFSFVDYELRCSSPVASLADVPGDAVFVATGAGGDAFGLDAAGRTVIFRGRPVVFGGGLAGADPVAAIADGTACAKAIESFFLTGRADPPPKRERRVCQLRKKAPPAPAVPVPESGVYSPEELMAEAGRCADCRCDNCYKNCDLLQSERKYPPPVAEEVYYTVHPGGLFQRDACNKRLIGSCLQCGLCRDLCPEGLPTGEMILQARAELHAKGADSWAFHDFWMRDMDHASGPFSLCRTPGGGTCPSVFFPGCQLGGSDPRYVLESYRWLREKEPDTGLWLNCCGIPAVWAGEEQKAAEHFDALRRRWEELGRPAVVFACASCARTFHRYLPEIPRVMLYEKMADSPPPVRGRGREEWAIFDPCASRDDPALSAAVRRLADRCALRHQDLPGGPDAARCCSWGGHAQFSNRSFVDKVAEKRAAESPLPYLTYCANCRDILSAAGKKAVHILDVVFDLAPDGREATDCSQRRENRELLYRRALALFGETPPEAPAPPAVRVDASARKVMARDMILVSDAAAIVARCEADGSFAEDPETGLRTGYGAAGGFTCWVVYRMEDVPVIVNVYSHRMHILSQEVPDGMQG